MGFYQLYGGANSSTALDPIVAEQLESLRSSGLAAASKKIVWTYVGDQFATYRLPSQPSEGKTYEKSAASASTGTEELSLTNLYQHCLSNRDDKVFYIHSKGSFTTTPANTVLRQNHMKAITSNGHCWGRTVHPSDDSLPPNWAHSASEKQNVDKGRDGPACSHDANMRSVHATGKEPVRAASDDNSDDPDQDDICGFRFSPMPHPHFTGNMWWARCDYVVKLIPPREFPAAMAKAAKSARDNAMLGTGRYSYEHWIASHPSARVADVLPTEFSFCWNYKGQPPASEWSPQWALFPRGLAPAHYFKGQQLRNGWPQRRLSEYKSLFGDNVTQPCSLPASAAICNWPRDFAGHHLGKSQVKTPSADKSVEFVLDFLWSERELGPACGRRPLL